jgi:hypothetical protein
VDGLDLKADAVRASVLFYRLAAEVGINPVRLSRLLNNHDQLDEVTAQRIRAAIARLASPQTAGVA